LPRRRRGRSSPCPAESTGLPPAREFEAVGGPVRHGWDPSANALPDRIDWPQRLAMKTPRTLPWARSQVENDLAGCLGNSHERNPPARHARNRAEKVLARLFGKPLS
jgi:hypothetical protein